MNTLIRLISAWIARRLESGNTRGALLGAVFGTLCGAAIAHLTSEREAMAGLGHATYIIFALVGAFAGGATGAAMPTRERIVAGRAVRLNNLNRALVPFFVASVLAAAVPLVLFGLKTKSGEENFTRVAAVVCASLSLLASIVGAREILWIDIEESQIVVCRLLSSQVLSFADIRRWGFELSRGKLLHTLPPVPGVPFVLVLSTGLRFELPSLSRATAIAVIERLSRANQIIQAG
jgi:hypothetical protein